MRRLAFGLQRHGGREEIDRALRHPPVSSEQVLHPESYFAGSKALDVRLAAAVAVRGREVRLAIAPGAGVAKGLVRRGR